MAAKASLLLGTIFLFILFLSHTVQTTATTEQNGAFLFIKQLVGSQKGQHVAGLNKLKKYLKKFGYLGLNHRENDEFDEALESAIKSYQTNFHLKATGKMDEDTVKQMMRPRCGVADVINVKRTQRWPFSKTHLTYRFISDGQPPLGEKTVKSIFAQAFQRWVEVTPFTFAEEPENPNADIEIEFRRGNNGDGNPFDGIGGVFGHVNQPETRGKPLHFDLNEDDKWSANPGTEEIDLESVAVHEIGHVLGLDHNTGNPEAMMYPSIDNGVAKRHLHQDDISRIHAIYGLK